MNVLHGQAVYFPTARGVCREWTCMSACLFFHVCHRGGFCNPNLSVAHISSGQRFGADLWCNQELISARLPAEQPRWSMHGNVCAPAPEIHMHLHTHSKYLLALTSFCPHRPPQSISNENAERNKLCVHLSPRALITQHEQHYNSMDGVNLVLSPVGVA